MLAHIPGTVFTRYRISWNDGSEEDLTFTLLFFALGNLEWTWTSLTSWTLVGSPRIFLLILLRAMALKGKFFGCEKSSTH